jgi:hypothetical protein
MAGKYSSVDIDKDAFLGPKITRVWAMPNKWTFEIKAIRELLCQYAGDGKKWVDPFAGRSDFAGFRNDLNPKNNQPFQVEASAYLESLLNLEGLIEGVIFDPPYSMEQIKRSYEDIGKKWDQRGTQNLNGSFPRSKDLIARLVRPGGHVISFGWNTVGMGIKRGFDIVEILIVCHGGHRNDTLCTVEKKSDREHS